MNRSNGRHIVQAPAFSQSYNGYAYAWNNPLKYNDPSGYANALSQDAYIPYEDRRGGWGGPVYDPMASYYHRRMEGSGYSYWEKNMVIVSFTPMTIKEAEERYKVGLPNLPEYLVTNLVIRAEIYRPYGTRNPSRKSTTGADQSGGSDGFNFDPTNTTIGAIGFGNDIKNELIGYAGKGSKLSPGVAKYLKISKGLGVVGGVVTTGYSASLVYDQYQQGGVNEVFQHRDVLDAGVGAVGLGATALATFGLISNPVGWAIGAGVLIYGGATLIYDAYNEP